MRITRNTAGQRIPVYLRDAFRQPVTGVVPVGAQLQYSKTGNSWTDGAGTWAEDSGGVYYYSPTQAETDTNSFLLLKVIVPTAERVVFSTDIGDRLEINQADPCKRRFPIYLTDIGNMPVSGLDLTTGSQVQISKNGAAFAAFAGTVTEIGQGAYYYEATLPESDTVGYVAIKVFPTGLPNTRYVYSWNVVSPSQSQTYRMRAFDVTLTRIVFWPSSVIDTPGANYTGPGPLTDVVVQDIIGQSITTTTVTPGIEAMPEMWAQQNVAASQTDVALSCLVSTNFDTIKMIRAGSIVGLGTRLTQAITAGTLTVVVTKNGVAGTLSIVHTSGTGSATTQAVGIDTYVAGDLIGIEITTTSGFLPITTDLEAWLEVLEAS